MRSRTLVAFCLWAGLVAAGPARDAGLCAQADNPLDDILAKARKYCQRLDKAALDFVCREEVKERVNVLRGPTATSVVPGVTGYATDSGRLTTVAAPPEEFKTTTRIYDYQFIRKEGDVKERRDLPKGESLEVERKDARIETRHFKFRDILFGPSILLGEAATSSYVYRVLKKEKVRGQEADVIACEARPSSAGRVLTGRTWVRRADGAVLRIAWDPESFSGYQDVLAIAGELKMSPAITSETEFGVERTGVINSLPSKRPTRSVAAETYLSFAGPGVAAADGIRLAR